METTATTQQQIIKLLTNASEIKGGDKLVTDFETMYLGFVSSQVYDDMDGREREFMTLTFLQLQKALGYVSQLTPKKTQQQV